MPSLNAHPLRIALAATSALPARAERRGASAATARAPEKSASLDPTPPRSVILPAESAPGTRIALRGVRKQFAGQVALDGIDLDIRDGEFLALLGPSGSGKTTLLRLLAGLDFADAGSMRADARDLAALDARERGVGLVFQHYALFRHMTVFDNVAFGLRVRPRRQRPSAAEIARRVRALLERVQLAEFAQRYPAQLSGGQRQRVALARALAIEPKVLLLDEPFGALDAQVRKELRRWLRHLHEDMGLTSVLVTHDQEEALELADRVVVMQRGCIEQVDTPEQVYAAPATPFVYQFIGSADRITCELRRGEVRLGDEVLHALQDQALGDGPAVVFVRPQHWQIGGADGDGIRARVGHIYAAGSVFRVELVLAGSAQTLEAELAPGELHRLALQQGSSVRLQARELTVFDATGARYHWAA